MTIKEVIVAFLFAVVLFASGWAIKGNLYPTVIDNTVTDSVYVDVPYEVEVIKEVEKPVRYTEYVTEYDTIETISMVKDTVFVQVEDGSFTYDTRFLTSYPNTPRFLGLSLRDGSLSFTGQRITGETTTLTWNIGDDDFVIGSNGGDFVSIQRAQKNKKNFISQLEGGIISNFQYWSPYVEARINLRFLTAGVNINKHPYIKIGVTYDLY